MFALNFYGAEKIRSHWNASAKTAMSNPRAACGPI